MQKRQGLKIASGLIMGSSMMLMTLLPAASAMAATAPAVTSVTLSGEQGTVKVGNTVSFTATATQTGNGTPMYNFWYQGVNGHWHSNGWSSSNSFSLPALQNGSYEVVVYSADKGQTTPVNSEGTNSNQFVNVNSTLKVSTNASSVAPLSPVTITAQSTNLTNAVYQYWLGTPNGNGGYNWRALNVNGSNGDYSTATSATFTPSNAGNYQIAVYAKDLNAPQTAKFSKAQALNEVVYGSPVAVKLSAAHSNLVADGQSTDTITATVVDKNGNTVGNFNGTVDITDSVQRLLGPNGNENLTLSGTKAVTIANGVGTFQIQAGNNVGTVQALTPSGMTNAPSGVNITYSGTSVTQTSVQPTKVNLSFASGAPTYLGSGFGSIPTTITYQLADAGGYSTPSMAGQYVTYTISGPGSFSSTSVVTKETLWTDGTPIPLQVYGEQGQSGTISVTASGTGVQGQLQIPLYVNTSPASLSMTSKNATGANGNPYTLYTVQLLDTNGHPIFGNSNTITVSNNVSAPGQIEYGTISSSGSFVPGSAPTSLVNGQVQFAVRTVKAGTSPVTIKVADPTHNFTANATYDYTANAASTVSLTPSSTVTNYTVKPGQSVTYTAQLTDKSGNPVTESGKAVKFSFASPATGVTFPNGLNTGTYTATTNAQGQASVTVNVSANATPGNTFQLAATYGSATAVNSGQTEIVNATDYGTQVHLTGTPTVDMSAGQTISGVVAAVENADGNSRAFLAGSTLKVTTSNSNVVAVNGTNNGPTEEHTPAGAIPNLVAGQAGSATITVQDMSDPSMPKASFTVNVVPDSNATSNPYVEYQGKQVNGQNPLSVTANTPVALTVVNVDQGGNPIPVTGTSPLVVSLSAPSGGHYRLSPNGASVNDVKIQPGSSSTTVYYVQGTSGSVSSLSAADSLDSLNGVVTPSSFTAGTSGTVTLKMGDFYGNTDNTFSGNATVQLTTSSPTETGSFDGQTLSSGAASATVDFTNGVATVPVTLDTGAQATQLTFSAATGSTSYGSVTTSAEVVPALTTFPTISSAQEAASGAALTWGSVSGAASYQVLEKAKGATSWTGVSQTDGGKLGSGATSTTVSGLTTGDQYTFEVLALDQYGNATGGPASSPVTWGAAASGTVASGAVSFTGATSGASGTTGTVTVSITYDNAMTATNAAASGYTLSDSSHSATLTGTKTSVSGDTVTVTFTIPTTDSTMASGDSFTVTSSGLQDAAGAPATTNESGTL